MLCGDFNVSVRRSRTLAELMTAEWGFSGATPIGIDHVLVRGLRAGAATGVAGRAASPRRPAALGPCARRGGGGMTYDEGRALFPVLERFAYLNAGTLGPLARPTLTAMQERARYDQDQGRGGREWFESILALRAGVREQLAALHRRVAGTGGADELDDRRVQHRPRGSRAGPGDEVVTTDSEHPGLLLPLNVSGARVRVAEVAGRPTAEALDRIAACVGPKTRLLALSHVLWTTGQVMPVQRAEAGDGSARARRRRAVGRRDAGRGRRARLLHGVRPEVAVRARAARRAVRPRARRSADRVSVLLRAAVDRARRVVRPDRGCGALRLRVDRDAHARRTRGALAIAA